MCNLYNIATSQEAIRQLTRALRDIIGNLDPSIDIYPNQFAANPLRGNPASRTAAGLPRRAGVDAADQPRLDPFVGCWPGMFLDAQQQRAKPLNSPPRNPAAMRGATCLRPVGA